MAQARLLSLLVCTCDFGTIYSMAQAGLQLTCTCDFGTIYSMAQARLLLALVTLGPFTVWTRLDF